MNRIFLAGEGYLERAEVRLSVSGLNELNDEQGDGRRDSGKAHGLFEKKKHQCSCLENSKDRGAWWAAVSGTAQSQTRLKRLSSSSSSSELAINAGEGERVLALESREPWTRVAGTDEGGWTSAGSCDGAQARPRGATRRLRSGAAAG